MKITAKLLVVILFGQLLFGLTAQAATAPALSAPPNTFIYLELNTAKKNPLQGKLATMIRENAADTDNQTVLNTIADNIENTNIGFSQSFHQTDGSEIYFLSVALPAEDFDAIINGMTDELQKKNLGGNRMLYLTSEDFFFAYKNGNLIASNKEGILSDLLIQENISSLQQNPDWQFLQGKSSPESFFKMFINFEQLPTDLTTEQNPVLGEINLQDMVKSEGFSLLQTTNGLNGIVTVNPGFKTSLNPANLAFSPELFKKIDASNLLFFSESNNLATNLQESINTLSQLSTDSSLPSPAEIYDELSTAIVEMTGLDPDTEIAPLFRNRAAFALHSQVGQQYFPGITLISEVKGQETLAKSTLDKLRNKILASIEGNFKATYEMEESYQQSLLDYDSTYQPTPLPPLAELEKQFFTSTSVTVNGTTYDQISFDPDASSYFYANGEYKSDPKMVTTISTAVTGDGLMIISTQKDLTKTISANNSLSADPEWQKSYTGGQMLDLSFVNLINISSYIKSLALESGATEEDIKPVMDFMAPLKSLYASSTYENGYYIGNLKFNFDLSQMSQLISSVESLVTSMTDSYSRDFGYEPIDSLEQGLVKSFGFSDVDEGAWYAHYVNTLAYIDIMKGYGTEFHPNQNITRAEFVKTLMSAYDYAGFYTIDQQPASKFKDVPADAWFAPYVNRATVLSVIKGYSDNTFRPNQPINRAEAMTMLINLRRASNSPDPGLKELPFTDVPPTDWFYGAVQKAFSLKYVTGKTATVFAPSDYLTRAETAAIITRYLDNY